jgi:2-amino-4-hydroxy-6-hydroxymethyldihydropteridine diphosphokinase
MQKILQIEKQLGRIRNEKWGPRTIDIDILLFDNMILRDNDLIIPHPQMQNRNFVLAPLSELAPSLPHPSLKKSMKQLAIETSDKLPIKKLLFL